MFHIVVWVFVKILPLRASTTIIFYYYSDYPDKNLYSRLAEGGSLP